MLNNTSGSLSKCNQIATAKLPDVIGLGVPKAASSRLSNLLSRHPQVHFPSKDTNILMDDDVETMLRRYDNLFQGADPASVYIDFSVLYLSSPLALERAAALPTQPKYFIIIRNPEEQVISLYWHLRRMTFNAWLRHKRLPSLQEAVEEYRNLLIAPALYGSQIKRWQESIPNFTLKTIYFDDFVEKPNYVLSDLFRWLELSADFDDGMTIEKPVGAGDRRGVQPRGRIAEAIYVPLYRWTTTGPYHAAVKYFGIDRVDRIKRRLKFREIAEAVFFRPGYPDPTPAEIDAIRSALAEDRQVLRELLGEDIERRWPR